MTKDDEAFEAHMDKLAETDPFHAMELRIMKAQRDQRRDAYREKLKNMTSEEFEAQKKRTAELLERSPYRRK